MYDNDKQTVMGTRKKNKAKGSTPNEKKGDSLKSQIADLKQSIAAMKSKTSNDDTADNTDSSDAPNNAGDAFGGRASKKHKWSDGIWSPQQLKR
jgi:hypothetical protein